MRRVLIAGWCLAGLALASGAPPAAAAELVGRVEVVSKGRAVPGEAGRTVVWFEPDRPGAAEPADGSLEMITRRKEFTPRILVAETGATVAFPNRDPILHNVFSVSDPRPFDLGLLGEGESRRVRFERPGVVRVFCNVHHDMVGYVLVLDTPFHASPDARGSFRLRDLPAGPGTLTVWHEQAEPWTARLTLPADGPVRARIELTRPRIPPHLDKFGRSYRERRRDRYRGN